MLWSVEKDIYLHALIWWKGMEPLARHGKECSQGDRER